MSMSEFKPNIICDVHEVDSGNPDRLKKLGANVIIEPLEAGDYILSQFTAIERKTFSDLHGSMIGKGVDHHVYEQIRNMKKLYPTVILAVIGEKLFKGSPQDYAMVSNGIKHCQLIEGAIIMKFADEDAFCKKLYDDACWLQGRKHTIDIPRLKEKEKELLKVDDWDTMRKYWLQGHIHCGVELANLLIKEFPIPYDFVTWLRGCYILYTKTGNEKGYYSTKKIDGVGIEFVKKNQMLLFGKINEEKDK